MKTVKLIKIDAEANNNKFYNMTQLDDNNFEIHFGRVGTEGRRIKDTMNNWDSTYNSKKRKGYNDVSTNAKITRIGDATFKDLKPKVQQLLEMLNKYAKEAFKINYTVEVSDISELLVEEAQEIIDKINGKLAVNVNISEITMLLLALYKKIPRKIKNVKESLIPPITDAAMLDKAKDKMTVEQGLLDVVKSQLVKSDGSVDAAVDSSKVLSFLDRLGLDIEEVSAQEETMLKNMLTNSANKYISAYKVINYKTQKLFDSEVAKAANKKTMLLFHGSRSENWLGIIKSGLVLHPNAVTTGKLFDHGIYFADVADKSLGYISGGRWNSSSGDNDNWLAVYDVHVGKQATYKDVARLSSRKPDLAKFVPDNGFDSYFADHNIEQRYNLARDEFIIYDEHKCTIKYLIHL